jgi:hypothetical protein
MGDHEILQLAQSPLSDDEAYARYQILGGLNLCLDKNTISWILNHTDCFVSQSRGNTSVQEVKLFPFFVRC